MFAVNQDAPELKQLAKRFMVHRIRLAPNNKQRTYFRRACGIKRLAYNWAKAESLKLHHKGVRASGFDLCKRFNSIKDQDFHFVREVSKWVPQMAIYNFWDALIKYFKGKKGTGPKCGFPRFKKKNKSRDSFYIGPAKVIGRKLHVPNLGPVKMLQDLRFPGKVRSVTISRDADFWFASVLVEVDESWVYPHTCETQAVVGMDLGLKDLAILSDGTPRRESQMVRYQQEKITPFEQTTVPAYTRQHALVKGAESARPLALPDSLSQEQHAQPSHNRPGCAVQVHRHRKLECSGDGEKP